MKKAIIENIEDIILKKIVKNVKAGLSNSGKIKPIRAEFELTKRCNLKCPFCFRIGKTLNFSELSDIQTLNILEELLKTEVIDVDIVGAGEPTLRKELLIKMAKLCKQKAVRFSFTTNGSNLNKIIENFYDMPYMRIFISLDFPDEQHDIFRGKGTFKKIFSFLVEFAAYKKFSKWNGPRVYFKTILLKDNMEKIGALLNFACKFEVDGIYFIPLMIFDRSQKQYRPLQSQYRKAYKYISHTKSLNLKEALQQSLTCSLNKQNDSGDEINLHEKNFYNKIPCFYPWYNITISAKGDMGPCCSYSHLFCNLQDWNGEKMIKLRKRLLNKFESCANCTFEDVIEKKLIIKNL